MRIKVVKNERMKIMKKKQVSEERKKYNRRQFFVKLMAGFLALLMVGASLATIIYALAY